VLNIARKKRGLDSLHYVSLAVYTGVKYMSPGQHFIISWVTANTIQTDRRSRFCITASGLLPDLDGVGYVYDKIALNYGVHTSYYEQFHHIYGHNIFTGLFISAVFFFVCGKRLSVFFLSLIAFNLHIMGDVAGAKGPDGDQWPIPYFYPLNQDIQLIWSGQWELSSWINSAIGVAFFIIAIIIARYRHVTFFELISPQVETLVKEAATKRGFFKFNKQLNRDAVNGAA
jgi:hypothetical protein